MLVLPPRQPPLSASSSGASVQRLPAQRWTRTTRKMRRGRVRMQKKQSIMADPFSSPVHVAVLIRECQLLFRCEFTPFGNRNEKRTHTVQTNVLRPLFRTDGSILRFPLCFRVMNIIPATQGLFSGPGPLVIDSLISFLIHPNRRESLNSPV